MNKTPRFARVERLMGEISDLIRSLNDRDSTAVAQSAALVIAVHRLERDLEDIRSGLTTGLVSE